MRYTIEGFSQAVAIELGLDVRQLAFLRWLIDFRATGQMEMVEVDGRRFFWVSRQKVMEELPIFGFTCEKSLSRMMKALEPILEVQTRLTQGGKRCYYAFRQDRLERLISSGRLENPQGTKMSHAQRTKMSHAQGTFLSSSKGQKCPMECDSNTMILTPYKDGQKAPISALSVDKPVENKRSRFVPPTVEEVRAYCVARRNTVNANKFVDFYTSNGWMVGKNKMVDWKAAIRNRWEDEGKSAPADNTPRKKADPNCADCFGRGTILAPGSGKLTPCYCTKDQGALV